MGRLLLIDGDDAHRLALASALRAAPHDVMTASTADAGCSLARTWKPELVVVDVAPSDGTSTEVCRLLRGDPTTAGMLVLIVGAAATEVDRVDAFEAGADDFVARPFSTRELLLRSHALLRRMNHRALPEVVALGSTTIDRGTRRVTDAGAAVELTRREFDLLVRLIDGGGRVLGRDTLVRDVWAGEAPSERVVDTTLKRLRKKLPGVGRRIRTIRGVGYELSANEPDAE